MSSPRDELVAALVAWRLDEARERLTRERGEPPSRRAAIEQHAALRSMRFRGRFEDLRERGALEGEELGWAAAALRDAHAAVGRARADLRVAEVLGQRVPHDSDHFSPTALFTRLSTEPHPGRRKLFGRSLDAFAPALLRAFRDGIADLEESLEPARWLAAVPLPPDRAERGPTIEAARALSSGTDELYAEVLARVAHAERLEVESWPDLVFALRAPRFDDLVDPRRRWRRVAEPLAALGVPEALGKRAHVETAGEALPRLRVSVIALAVPGDVRIVPASLERGLASERDAVDALGRAVALAWTHPATPPLAAGAGSVGRALGALFAHLWADPAFEPRSPLSARDARAVREIRIALELTALRTEAAACLARAHLDPSAYEEAASEHLRAAWRIDVKPATAAVACFDRDPAPGSELRALRWAAPFHLALREHFDEDWWRNPRAAEPLRAACQRGGALSVEAWAAELGADASLLPTRYAELVR